MGSLGLDDAVATRWSKALLAINGRDPRWRRLMDLEGLPDEKAGYEPVWAVIGE